VPSSSLATHKVVSSQHLLPCPSYNLGAVPIRRGVFACAIGTMTMGGGGSAGGGAAGGSGRGG